MSQVKVRRVPNIHDVAKLAGVSAATVSRVLNDHPTVDRDLAQRVRRATSELGYRPNAAGRSLRRSRSSLWAVLVSDVENPFFTSMVRGIEDVAQKSGYSVILCNSDEDRRKEADYIAVALGEQVAGLVICPTSERSTDVSPLLDHGTPVVAVDRKLPGSSVDTILVDNVHAAATATDHLIDAGYRRIACVTGPRRATTARQRRLGYEQALRARGIPVDEDLIRHADFRESGGRDAMLGLLHDVAGLDAVVAANNLMTVGVLEALTESGRAVPGDVAVVAFDDIPWAGLVRPSLTTVAQPAYDMGYRAGELLEGRLHHPDRKPETLTLTARLIVRESSEPRRDL